MLNLTDDGAVPPTPIFTVELPIGWSDLDADGRVNNVRLLKLTEEACIQWLAALGLERLAPDCMPVLASTAAVFLYAVRYPARLE